MNDNQTPSPETPAGTVVQFPSGELGSAKPGDILPHGTQVVSQPPTFEAREPVAPAVSDVEQAHAAFSTLTGCMLETRERLAHLLNGVRQVPVQMQTRRNKRVLVFLDALEDLAELMDKELPTAPEAVEWWNNRNLEMTEAKLMRSDLRRLENLVEEMERDAGMDAAPGAEQLRTIDKIEDMTAAMRQALEQQTGIIKQLRVELAAERKRN